MITWAEHFYYFELCCDMVRHSFLYIKIRYIVHSLTSKDFCHIWNWCRLSFIVLRIFIYFHLR